MADADFRPGQYEFQSLHGMGEPLYEQVVGDKALRRPCRIYAPVGTHETLLAYLVRRLLENGANSSFVNRIADASVPISRRIEDPVTQARKMTPIGAPHPKIALPRDLYGPSPPVRRTSILPTGSAHRTLPMTWRIGRRRQERSAALDDRSAIPPIDLVSLIA